MLLSKLFMKDNYVTISDLLELLPDFGYTELGALSEDEFTYDKSTGIMTILSQESDIPPGFLVAESIDKLPFERLVDALDSAPEGLEACIILEFTMEKYRSIDDLKGMEQEKVNTIASMQSIQGALLEYYYQFSVATKTQTALWEIGYTTLITVASIAIGSVAMAKIGSCIKNMDFSGVKLSDRTANAIRRLTRNSLETLSLKMVRTSMITETAQELIVDPLMESIVMGITANLGWDPSAQLIASSIAESLREAITGPTASSTDLQIQQMLNDQVFQDMNAEIQALENLMATRQALEDQKATKPWYMKAASLTISALSTMALIWSAGSSAFLVNPILTAVTTLGIYCKVEGKSLTKFFGMVVGKFKTPTNKQLPNLDAELGFEEIASGRKFNWWKAVGIAAMAVIGVGLIMSGISQMLPAQISQVSSNAMALNAEVLRVSETYFSSTSISAISPIPNVIPFIATIGGAVIASSILGSVFRVRGSLHRFIKDTEGRYVTESGKIAIQTYAIEHVKKILSLKQLSEIGRRPWQKIQDFILTKNDIEKFSHIKSAVEFSSSVIRKRYLYLGFVYKISLCPDGRSEMFHKIGYTTRSGKARYYYYVLRAFNANNIEELRSKKNTPQGDTKTFSYYIRDYLEGLARLDGKTFEEYFSYTNSKGKVKKHLGKAMALLKPILKWEPQTFYWDINKMRDGEIKRIELSRTLTDSNLNIDKGGGGGTSKMWNNLDNILVYMSMGYSIKTIAEKLINSHGFTSPGGLSKVVNELYAFLRNLFGTMKNAQAMTIDKVISELEKIFDDKTIWESYKDYFGSRVTQYADFDQTKFLKLTLEGKTPLEMVPSLRMPYKAILKWISKYTDEMFQYLPDIFTSLSSNKDWLAFWQYMLAPIFINYFVDKGIALSGISQHMDGFSKYYPLHVIHNVYGMPATIISMASKLSEMNEKLVERPYATPEDFESSLSWSTKTIRRAMGAYVSKRQSGVSLYKQYEIARLGPKVQNFYKMGLPSSFIIKILPHFSSEVELISWSRNVFGFEGNPEEFFKTNT